MCTGKVLMSCLYSHNIMSLWTKRLHYNFSACVSCAQGVVEIVCYSVYVYSTLGVLSDVKSVLGRGHNVLFCCQFPFPMIIKCCVYSQCEPDAIMTFTLINNTVDHSLVGVALSL